MKLYKIILKSFLLLLIFTLNIQADTASLLATVKKMPLLHNGTNIVKDNDTLYLVGVGESTIKGADILSKVNAIKVAKTLAQKAILSFTHGLELTVDEKLSKTTTNTQLVINNKVITNEAERIRVFERVIHESGSGILVGLESLGKWKEGKKYYFAYFLKIPSS